jgi:hypothetical protein
MPSLESLSQVSPALLDFIVQGCESMIVRETTGLDRIKRTKKDIFGRNILIKYRLKGNAGAGSAVERGTLPRAKARVFEEGLQTLRYSYIPVELTGQEIRVPHGKKGAILDIVTDAMEDATLNGMHKFDNDFWGDGSGRYAQVAGSPSYDSGTGLTSVTFDHGVKEWFLEGQDVSFGTYTTLWEIFSIDESSNILYITGDCTGQAANDVYIYNGGDYSASYNVVPWGVQIHCGEDNGVHSLYQNLDRTAAGYSWLQAYVNDNNGSDRAISSILLTQHFQKVKRRGGKIPTWLLTEDGVLNSYVLLLESLHQQVAVMPNETGTKEMYSFVFAGKKMTLETSMKCPLGKIFCLDETVLELREAYPLQWDTEGGGKLMKERNEDVFWGRMVWYYNYICTNNKKLSLIADLIRNSLT